MKVASLDENQRYIIEKKIEVASLISVVLTFCFPSFLFFVHLFYLSEVQCYCLRVDAVLKFEQRKLSLVVL